MMLERRLGFLALLVRVSATSVPNTTSVFGIAGEEMPESFRSSSGSSGSSLSQTSTTTLTTMSITSVASSLTTSSETSTVTQTSASVLGATHSVTSTSETSTTTLTTMTESQASFTLSSTTTLHVMTDISETGASTTETSTVTLPTITQTSSHTAHSATETSTATLTTTTQTSTHTLITSTERSTVTLTTTTTTFTLMTSTDTSNMDPSTETSGMASTTETSLMATSTETSGMVTTTETSLMATSTETSLITSSETSTRTLTTATDTSSYTLTDTSSVTLTTFSETFTETRTETSTTTLTTFTQSSTMPSADTSCQSAPFVLKGSASLLTCAGRPHGYTCAPSCKAGYTWTGGSIVCNNGNYNVTGACMFNVVPGAPPPPSIVVQAVTVTVDLISNGNVSQVTDFPAWADSHSDVIETAASSVLDVQAGLLRFEVREPPSPTVLLRLRFLVIINQGGLPATVDPSDPAQLEQWVGQLADSGTARRLSNTTAAGFYGALVQTLSAGEVSIPQEFLDASFVVSEPVQIEEDVYLPSPQWVVESWGTCAAACGDSVVERAVTCSTGSVAQCRTAPDMFQTGTEPASSMQCKSYAACPFDVMCPAGPSETGDCSSQQQAVAGAFVTAIFLSVACVCMTCSRCLRAPTGGARNLKGVVVAKDGSSTVTYDISEDLEGGKKRVVWNIDLEGTKSKLLSTNSQEFAEKSKSLPDIEIAAVVDKWEASLLVERDPQETIEKASSAGFASPRQDSDRMLIPAFESGSKVEYYSSSNRRWVPGTVRVFRVEDDEGLRFTYTVDLLAHRRYDVPLDRIREPLCVGEQVDVLTKRGWTEGTVVRDQIAILHSINYDVRLMLQGAVQDVRLPAERLQRRFQANVPVEVFRGAAEGWVPAVVAGAAGAKVDGAGRAAVSSPTSPEDQPLEDFSAEPDAPMEMKAPKELTIEPPWAEVRVMLGGDAAGATALAPLNLVRYLTPDKSPQSVESVTFCV